eukprot:scaffold1869_cov493-Prasinococcus_capsulatus_cf.AAC.6
MARHPARPCRGTCDRTPKQAPPGARPGSALRGPRTQAAPGLLAASARSWHPGSVRGLFSPFDRSTRTPVSGGRL